MKIGYENMKSTDFRQYAAFNILKRSAVSNKLDAVLKHSDSERRTGIEARTLPFQPLFSSGPIRMTGGVVKSFRMRHQSENPTGGITDTGNILNRSIGIIGELLLGRISVRHCILHRDLIGTEEPFDGVWVGIKFTFSVPHRQVYYVYAFGKNARRIIIDF